MLILAFATPTLRQRGREEVNAQIPNYLPVSPIGQNFVLTYSMGGVNYFGIQLFPYGLDQYADFPNGLTVQQAYDIDIKIDDGSPITGNVIACTPDHDGAYWAGTGWPCYDTTDIHGWIGTSSVSCFDNNAGAYPTRYSTSNNANAQNCALSFKFQ